MRKNRVLVVVTLALGLAVLPAAAQETTAEPETQAEKDAQAANANNPLANMVSFNIQNYYSAELYGTDETSNTAWLRLPERYL